MTRQWLLYILLIVATVAVASADGYRMSSSTVNSGGLAACSAEYRIEGTVGQTAVGVSAGSGGIHWAGFWSGRVPVPVLVTNSAAAKTLADGAFVCLAGKVATTSTGDFGQFLFVEETNRSSGIRVTTPAMAVPSVARGNIVNVIGSLGTGASSERLVAGSIVLITGSQDPLSPLAMTNRSVGGGPLASAPFGQPGVIGGRGLNNIGLLIKTWGRVIGAESGRLLLDDGSGGLVTLDVTNLRTTPAPDSYVSVTGISVLPESGDRYRTILPRDSADIATQGEP